MSSYTSSEDSSADSDTVEELMNLLLPNPNPSSDGWSSDGWEDDSWRDFVRLPDESLYRELPDDVPQDYEKFLRQHFLTQKYSNGVSRFKMDFDKTSLTTAAWVIYRVCPCGIKKCAKHYDGSEKQRPFLQWSKICDFPKGHELKGVVRCGQELETLRRKFSSHYKVSTCGDKYIVEQMCPCGKTECAIHMFPSKVELVHSFDLCIIDPATRSTSERKTLIEPLFRKQHAMTKTQARLFFDQFEYKWELDISINKIAFKMVCRCGLAFEDTPCNTCWMKMFKKCHICKSLRRNRMLSKCHPSKNCLFCVGICSDCKAAEITFCQHCKKNERLDHVCIHLRGQHYSFRKNTTYPPLLYVKRSDGGICPDCKLPQSYNGYHRHSYRRHNDKKPCDLYLRDYKKIFCELCNYYHYDKKNIREHRKFHSLKKTHPCKSGCGMSFTHACSEIAHRKKVHGYKTSHVKRKIRRVGQKIVIDSK
jgi:hypothetical protein